MSVSLAKKDSKGRILEKGPSSTQHSPAGQHSAGSTPKTAEHHSAEHKSTKESHGSKDTHKPENSKAQEHKKSDKNGHDKKDDHHDKKSKKNDGNKVQNSPQVMANKRLGSSEAPKLNPKQIAESTLLQFSFMTEEQRSKLKECKLDLTKSKSRCEMQHGPGKCVQTEIGYRKVCPEGTELLGCCLCAQRCPTGYTEKQYTCLKPESTKLNAYFSDKRSCEDAVKSTCESWVGAFWVPKCKSFEIRVGASQCVPRCPIGWSDLGRECVKPTSIAIDIGTPFIWQPEDENL